jgi:hypothetical protein
MPEDAAKPHRRGTRRATFGLTSLLIEALATKARAGRFGGRLIVRCHDGHLFTTLWIPGASVKSIRFAWWRLQRCPVGHHWSIVTPVNQAKLSPWRARAARRHHDVPVP